MILIVTHKEDYTADFLISKLNDRKVPYYRFNCEDILSIQYRFDNSNFFSPEIMGIQNFNSVWFRRTKLPRVDDSLKPSEKAYLLLEYDALLNNMLQSISSPKWLSNPNDIYKAENKTFQLKVAQSVGFKIPPTLMTNKKEEILEFAKKNENDIVIKTLNSGRIKSDFENRLIYTNILNQWHISNIEKYDITPCIFQKNIKKEYEIRVTVVNKDVFAAKVNSQNNEVTKIDWRKEKLLFTEYQLPENILHKCINIVSSLNLSFGAIDLIKSIDGEYYFLEINPNGQWAWIEIDTKQPISDSIIKFLRD